MPGEARNAPLLFPLSNEEKQLLEEDSDGDIEEGLVPHGRSTKIMRLGPPICCCVTAALLIIIGFAALHHSSHFKEKTISDYMWELTLFVVALMIAMGCLVLACVSFSFNVVPEEGPMENYVITKKINEGAFGAVYKAFHHEKHGTKTPVALKFCKLGSQEELNAGINEAVYQAGEKHENLVHCQDIFLYKKGTSFLKMLMQKETPYSLCIALDLCSGDVQGHIKKWYREPSSWPGYDIVLHIFKQATMGVECLHKKGLIHRDLKPENLFVSLDKKYVKVGDLGLVEQTSGQGAEEGEDETGTPGYIAPEVYGGQKYSTRADQWSMGCIIFDLVKPAEEGSWSLAAYVGEQLAVMGRPCQEMIDEGDIWYGFGEHGKSDEAVAIAAQAPEVTRNQVVKKAFTSCMKADPHARISSTALLAMLQ
jgi:serine/threonine protein kinase|mmetsp:Transcript_50375/g.79860  ORF Transcript_50375/g.79860 Transcript_50375/m.79860 type:complete len:423 (+) Transcript_50375:74-1342(+)